MDKKVFLKEETVVSIADVIREKSGSSEKMTPAQMAVRIQNLTVGGSEDLINDLNAIHGEEAKSTAEEAITTIEENVDEQAGLIEQIQTALEGKTSSGGGVAYVGCGAASTDTHYAPDIESLKNYNEEKTGTMVSFVPRYPIPIGWYVTFPTTIGSFPSYANPESSVEIVETFTHISGYECYLVKVIGDFVISMDD